MAVGSLFHVIQQVAGIFKDGDRGQGFLVCEAFCRHVIQQGQQAVVVAAEVQNSDGLLMTAQLAQGQDLEKLFQGSDAAGNDDEAVRTDPPSAVSSGAWCR